MGLNGSLGETAVPLADALYQQGRYGRHEDARHGEGRVGQRRRSDRGAAARVRAKLLAARGWEPHALRAADRALRLVRRTDWACLQSDTLIAYAEVLRLAGREDDALESLHEALGLARAKGYKPVAARRAEAVLQELGAPDAQHVS